MEYKVLNESHKKKCQDDILVQKLKKGLNYIVLKLYMNSLHEYNTVKHCIIIK